MTSVINDDTAKGTACQNQQFNIILSGDRTIELYSDSTESNIPLPFQKIDKIPRTPLLFRSDEDMAYSNTNSEVLSCSSSDDTLASRWETGGETQKSWPVIERPCNPSSANLAPTRRNRKFSACRCQIL